MTHEELQKFKPGGVIFFTGGVDYFTAKKGYIVYDSPVGKTVQNDNGVNKFIYDMLDSFELALKMTNIKNNVKCTMIKPPYIWHTTDGFVSYNYHSAHTIKNTNWKWWKFWAERFISVPSGWTASFSIKGKIELDLTSWE